MSNFPNCDNATYIGTMYESKNDQLSNGEIFASSNCEYLLRAEPNELCLYSVSEHKMLSQWHMHHTIWDIRSHSDSQILTFNVPGCLTWFNNDTSINDQYCDPNIGPTTTYYSSTPILTNNSSTESNKSNIANELCIPLSVTIIAVIFALIFLIILCRKNCNKNLYTEYEKPSDNKQYNDHNNNRNDIEHQENDDNDNSMNVSHVIIEPEDNKNMDYMTVRTQIKYGLNVPVRYDNESESESEIDTENDEIKENELDIDYNKSDSLMVQRSNNNKRVEISFSDLSDSDEAPEPEIAHLKKMRSNENQYKPTKVKKGENKFAKFKK